MLVTLLSWIVEIYNGLFTSTSVLKTFTTYDELFSKIMKDSRFTNIVAVITTVGVSIMILYFLIDMADKASSKNINYEYFIKTFIKLIPVDKCIWEYNGTVYEGDRFNRDKLSGYVAYEDGRREALKDFTLKYAPLVFGGGSSEISVETPFGTDTISVEAVRVTGIRMDGKKTIYEGKHKGKDFLFTLLYSDGTTRSIPSSDVYLPKFKLVSGKNHVTVSYNDRPYIVTVEAKSRRQ